ncbi:MAG: response regulator [Thermodesulfobacteriota bacterium]
MTDQFNKTVLLVDDDRMFLDSLEQFMLQRGYYSKSARDAESALKIIRDFSIDVVVADVVLPGKDGIALMNEAKALFPDMDFIIMTGHTGEHSYVEIINAGASDYLVKPFEMMELVARIERIKREKKLVKQFQNTNERLMETVNQVNRMMNEVRQTAQAKSDLLASISHEIRTPLTGILGFTDILLSTGLNDEQMSYAANIKMSGEVLLSLLNDLLDSSKIEAGKMKLENIVFDPEIICFDVCDLIRPRLYRKPVELICRIDDNVPAKVYGDPHRFRQVLLNLMSNAAKFTGSGEVLLSLGARADDGDPDAIALHVAVKDTGIGLSPADMKNLFEPFRQFHDSTARHYGGTGLGLFLCKSIAALMHGDITVESAPGKGSVFHFSSRMKVVDGGSPKRFRTTRVPPGKILVADNNQTNLEILGHFLESAGMTVELRDSCENIPDILGRAQKTGRPFDLCVIEAALASEEPGDFFYIQKIRKTDPPTDRIPLIATSDPFSGSAGKCLEAGFDGFLPKPLRRDQLFFLIHHLIHGEGGSPVPAEPPCQPISGPRGIGEDQSRAAILLAEDNPVNQKLVVAILKKAGYPVTVAEDGRQAVERYTSAPDEYRLILMDVQMPELDGIAAAREIRQWESGQDLEKSNPGMMSRHVCIIAVTAGAVDQDKSRYVQVGMDDILFKPIQADALLNLIRKWLEKPCRPESP